MSQEKAMDIGAAYGAAARLRRAYAPLWEQRTWRAALFLVLDLPIAWICGAILLGALLASAVLAPVAIVVLAAVLTAIRRLSAWERWRARRLLGLDVPSPPPLQRGRGFVAWVAAALKDQVAWRGGAYLVVRLALGNAAFFGLVFATWATGALLTTPIWVSTQDAVDFSRVFDTWWEQTLAVSVGFVALAVLPRIVQGFGSLSGRAVQWLLGPPAGERIIRLEGQRSSAVRTADVDRRRIEQDLHDGAQMRLTALAMQLGLAKEAIAEGAGTARIAELVDDAHRQSKLALREIRDLARGIHPAILTDRGLGVALESLVGRLPVPVDLEVAIDERPSPEVESVVYFVAAEGVTNAVRHANSPSVGLRVIREGDEILVEIRDRGRGGADPSRGTGLTNLRERVQAARGEMTVLSPENVGTLVRAVVPCGS